MINEQERSNYYVLACFIRSDGAEITHSPKLPTQYDVWMTGETIPVNEIKTPLNYVIEESNEGVMLPFFDGESAPLMSKKMVAALKTAGVDNLQTFDANVTIQRTKEVNSDYVAVNILGLREAADLNESEFDTCPITNSEKDDLSFDYLVLDEKKIGDAHFFRMAESVEVILVHRSVKEILEPLFPRLSFILPEDFSN